MNLYTEQKQTHGHKEQTCGCQGGGKGEGCTGSLGFEVDNMRKRMYIYVEPGHFNVQKELSEHCKSTVIKIKKKENRDLKLNGPSNIAKRPPTSPKCSQEMKKISEK